MCPTAGRSEEEFFPLQDLFYGLSCPAIPWDSQHSSTLVFWGNTSSLFVLPWGFYCNLRRVPEGDFLCDLGGSSLEEDFLCIMRSL